MLLYVYALTSVIEENNESFVICLTELQHNFCQKKLCDKKNNTIKLVT